MFTLKAPVVVCSSNKVAKKFKKFGKRMAKERQLDLERYGNRLKDIAHEERKRTRELFEEHRRFFEDNVSSSNDEPTSIDFFEK